MSAFLSSLLDIATLVFAVTSMLAVGLSYTFAQILAPLRDGRAVVAALVANFGAVPLLALIVISALNLAPDLALGLMLVATAAGAPFLIQLAHIARGDMHQAAGLLVLQLVVTIAYMPIVVPLIAPEAAVSAFAIARPLVLTMLLPLVVGLLVDRWNEPLACRLQPPLRRVSILALVTLVLGIAGLHMPTVMSVFGTGAILAALLVVAGAFTLGYFLARPSPRRRKVLGLGTAQRGLTAATVVATQSFDDPDIVVMVVVAMVVSMAVLFPVAWLLSRGERRRPQLRVTFLNERVKEPWV